MVTHLLFPMYVGALLLAGPVDGEAAAADTQEELGQIRQRLIGEWTLGNLPADAPFAAEALAQLDRQADVLLAQEGGYWSTWEDVSHPEISYTGFAFGAPRQLLTAYVTPRSRHHRSRPALAAAEAGLRHLLKFVHPGCPRPGNWWAWQIGVPMNLTPTLILAGADLDPALGPPIAKERDWGPLYAQEVATVEYLLGLGSAASRPAPKKLPPPSTDMNQLWHHMLRLEAAVLLDDAAMARYWALQSCAEMTGAGQGHLQADFSYKFHGEIPMWTYGRSFLMDYPLLMARLAGTSLASRPDQADRYGEMLEHFVQGFLYRGRICPAIIGRELTRGDRMHEYDFVLPSLAIMARGYDPSGRMARLLARELQYHTKPPKPAGVFAAHVRAFPATEPAPPADDVFAYPDSDFLQVTRQDWAVGIKMHSVRNCGYESINGENLQGWFLSHGSMFHFIRGDEWDGCWPTLDWTRLPGTTVAANNKSQNTSPFVGVLRGSDRVALAAMELKGPPPRTTTRGGTPTPSLTALKSWLVDGEAIVCLGSEIRGTYPVETTVVNQPVPRGAPVLMNGEPAGSEPFERTLNVRTLWLQDMSYVFPDGQELLLIRQRRTSDWSSVREPTRHGRGEPVTHEYITAVIRHTRGSDGYRYIMVPNVAREDHSRRAEEVRRRYRIELDGSHHVRTVDGEVESLVCWGALGEGPIRVDRGCMMVRVGGRWQVVDPTWTDAPLQVAFTSGDRQSTKPQRVELRLQRGRPALVESKP